VQRVAFVTDKKWVDLTPDDRLAIPACAAVGIEVVPAIWSDQRIDWRSFAAVVVRSTWDYHLRPAAFDAWLSVLAQARVNIWNPVTVLRWNAHKSYLLELAGHGIAIPGTRLFKQGSAVNLRVLLADEQWRGAVIKPAVSASSYRTHRVTGAPSLQQQLALETILADGDALMQEFVDEITIDGEWAMVFLAGRFSHAVPRRPKGGDFRVQEELGGSQTAGQPPQRVLAVAERVLALAPAATLYARVDVVDAKRGPLLMELELLEPALYFGYAEGAAERFAGAIKDRVDQRV